MSSQPTALQLAEAVLNSVRSGQYPDSEEIISAEVTPPVFSVALELLSNARDDVKVRLSFPVLLLASLTTRLGQHPAIWSNYATHS